MAVQGTLPAARVRLEVAARDRPAARGGLRDHGRRAQDPILGAEGAVVLLERLSPALEHVDSSSGAIGTAVHHAIAQLVPVIATAPADATVRADWLERLFDAHVLLVGWTGYILVWDDHARLLGAAGARLMDSLHVMATPIGRVFSGDAQAPASFFFLNLFVHMAIPLLMVGLLWVHTLRLARSRWLPDRRLSLGATAALTALSLLWPAGLGPAADGLTLGDRAVYDVFYTAWVPLAQRMSAPVAWAATLALVLLPLGLPLVWRPRREARVEPARHNPLACNGCTQCVQDCPFEAISMVPNTTGRGTHTDIAFVNVGRCVSC